MNCAIVLLDTGVKSEWAPAGVPGKGTSTGFGSDVLRSAYGPIPWLYAYRERY